ncbi:MAG: HAD family phosphatase [Candidatus ainarchaeum sp.]|nr:HAD family phosphatase [Candidatus ainarchaeum sp.]
MITTLFIDFGGVLTKGRYTAAIIKNLEKKAGFPLEKKYLEIDQGVVLLDLDKINLQGFTEKANEAAKLKLSQKEMAEVLGESINWDKTMLDFLPELKKNHRLVLFSNNNHPTVKILRARHKRVLDLFDRHYFSCELRLAKPDPEFFNHALKELKLKPEECLLVDDKEKNIKAAQEIGMKGIAFQNAEQLKQELKLLKII